MGDEGHARSRGGGDGDEQVDEGKAGVARGAQALVGRGGHVSAAALSTGAARSARGRRGAALGEKP